jgi:hypothetical protein
VELFFRVEFIVTNLETDVRFLITMKSGKGFYRMDQHHESYAAVPRPNLKMVRVD